MRKVIRAALALTILIFSPAVPALAQAGCGIAPIPPIPPIGCRAMEPSCVCTGTGQCHWEFVCIR